jgi:predicted nucleotidyltransferase
MPLHHMPSRSFRKPGPLRGRGLAVIGSPPSGLEEAIEGFAVETHDGLIFTVKGLVHPAGGVFAYLRYVPDPAGPRTRGYTRYRRVYGFEEMEDALRGRTHLYVRRDPVLGIRTQFVPEGEIRVVHDPRRLLRRLLGEESVDPVQASALSLARLLASEPGVPGGALGVSGSILVGLHDPSSDVDLVVYGERESRAAHEALGRLLDDPASPLLRPGAAALASIHEAHRTDTPLSVTDFRRLQERKVNEGSVGERPFFVRFVKRSPEVGEVYGDPRFESLGPAVVRARVYDHGDAIFTPCRYLIDDVTLEGCVARDDLLEIVSFRGRFSDQARAGERVGARGGLERVVPRSRPDYCRLVVGSHPGDYLVSLPD